MLGRVDIQHLATLGAMPNIIFFDPTRNFITSMVNLSKGCLVIDCGAGVGRVARLLTANGIRAVSIDIIEREEPESPVHLFDATIFPFQPSHIALIARPCRGFWIRETIDRAISQGATVVYAGLKKHFDNDLDLPYSVSLLCKKAGKNGEQAFVIRKG